MKRFLAIAIAASIGLFYSATANAAATGTSGITVVDISSYPVSASANGVVESRHNLGSFGSYTKTRDNSGNQTGTTQVCVFCHTPHHANTDTKPLWNRNMPNSSSYQGYGNTIAGTSVSKPRSGSVSLACLSCHDGVTTFDNLVNAPGKGLSMPSTSWTFFRSGSPVANKMTFSKRLNLGTDLTNDHPVNVKYEGGKKASLRPTNTTIGDIDLSTGLYKTTQYFGWMTENKWAVNGFISSSATIGDLLRSDSSTSGNVECSSCHDPHFSNKSYVEYTRDSNNHFTGLNVGDGMFLRRVGGNTGSGVCRTCHDK